jgi:serine phosphatase RsbU (regulator of sigma subunit)
VTAETASRGRIRLAGRKRHRAYLVLAVVLPLLVALVFPHPTRRLVVPESILLAIAVLLTLLDGVAPGIVVALLSPFFLWVFNVPPPYTFKFTHGEDVVAVLTTAAITLGLVVLIHVIARRERRAIQQQARLEQQVETQRTTITTMQHALLPDIHRDVSGVTLGWEYVPGGAPSVPIGGDWLAFVPIGATSVGIAIGDVAGHGLAAVRAMAEYRFALRALASEGGDPCEVLRQLDTIVSRLGDRFLSTCVYGVLDIERGVWTYASAGHPPALLVRDHSTEILAAPHGPPVGASLWTNKVRSASVVPLKRDDVLALYTDGLVEQRHEPIDDGIKRLANRLALIDDNADLPEASTAVISDLVGASPADDVAIILVRYRGNNSG